MWSLRVDSGVLGAWQPAGHQGRKEKETEANLVSDDQGLPCGPLWGHAPGLASGSLRAQLTPDLPPLPKCVVIGLQSTGEARTREVLDQKDGQLDCFVSAAE